MISHHQPLYFDRNIVFHWLVFLSGLNREMATDQWDGLMYVLFKPDTINLVHLRLVLNKSSLLRPKVNNC